MSTRHKELKRQIEDEFSDEEKEAVWNEAAAAVKSYHDELVRRWQAEMDSLLVYVRTTSCL